jgi:broad specificity phosphatase PhoE
MKRKTMLLGLLAGALLAPLARADDALWKLLQRGGQVVMVRHAVTDPGVGDPEGFRVEDCTTQRNLSDAGRREARRLGEALRAREVPVAKVMSSPWCRSIETARIAFGTAAELHPALGNLFGRPERAEKQVAELKKLVRRPERGNVFLVSHGSTTHALTGVSPGTAEMVVLTPQAGGGFKVAGRLAAP